MIRKLSTVLASLAVLAAPVAVAMANPTPAPARVPAPCVIQLGDGGTAPCPPPVVSTYGGLLPGEGSPLEEPAPEPEAPVYRAPEKPEPTETEEPEPEPTETETPEPLPAAA